MSSLKDLTYANRYAEVLDHFSELHYLQRTINGLVQNGLLYSYAMLHDVKKLDFF